MTVQNAGSTFGLKVISLYSGLKGGLEKKRAKEREFGLVSLEAASPFCCAPTPSGDHPSL